MKNEQKTIFIFLNIEEKRQGKVILKMRKYNILFQTEMMRKWHHEDF